MRIKQRIDDFRVRELLAADYLGERGEYRVYRVTKRKLTSLQAARELAYAAGVQASDVALAGLKDRQGVTTQHMSIRRGRDVDLRAQDLTVESVGFAREGLESRHSLGNAFEVALRGLMQEDLDVLRDNVPALRTCGVVNYFDEQRFGNLRHNQGWIAQQLMRGEHEEALKRLLASISPHDDAASSAFKHALLAAWGDWSACRDIAGRFGQHHSVFEHLKRNEGDFAGAFYHVSSRLRLIHLYAFQSHIWNRAVASCMSSLVPPEERVVLDSVEGPLVYPSKPLPLAPKATFRLPGAGLEDVRDHKQRGWLEDALTRERMVAADFQIQGVSGFALKGEERELFVEPRHLRVRPPERDNLNFGAFVVKVRFELQRGAYATLVVRRLLSSPLHAAGRERGADRGEHDPRLRHAKGDSRDDRGGAQRAFGAEPSSGGARGGSRKSPGAKPGFERREPPPQHRESGESLAPPPRVPFRRDRRDEPWRAPGGQGDQRSFQRAPDRRDAGYGSQRPFEQRGDGRDAQRTFDRASGEGGGGQRPSYRRDEGHDAGRGTGRPFDRERAQRPFNSRDEGAGAPRPFDARTERGGQRPFHRRDERGGQRPFDPRDGGGGQRPFDPRDEGAGVQPPPDRLDDGTGAQRSFEQRTDRPFEAHRGYGGTQRGEQDRRPFDDRGRGGEGRGGREERPDQRHRGGFGGRGRDRTRDRR